MIRDFVVALSVFFSSRRRHTRCGRDWSSDVCSSDLIAQFRLPQSLGSGSLGTDAILIGLINVNLILLVLLVFLVGRNIAKLRSEERRVGKEGRSRWSPYH